MNIEDVHKKRIFGLIGLCAKAGNIVCGIDATIQEIERKKVKLVIVAEDSSERTKKNIKLICQNKKIKIIEIGRMEELSMTIGKTNTAIIGIKSKSITDGIEKIIKENIGGDLL